jgi:hypothetical protein
MHAYVCKLKKITFAYRFLEMGHTQMEVDFVHAVIECAKKKTDIFEPKQFFALMRGAKKAGNPYCLHELHQTEFYEFTLGEKKH